MSPSASGEWWPPRRANVVGIFPNDEAIVRLVGAGLIQQNDAWAVARRNLTPETVARFGDPDAVTPPAIAAVRHSRLKQDRRSTAVFHHVPGHYLCSAPTALFLFLKSGTRSNYYRGR